jgi:hypothetical protein
MVVRIGSEDEEIEPVVGRRTPGNRVHRSGPLSP